MNGRAYVIVSALAFLGIALAVTTVVCAFAGNIVWMTCSGMLACWCALMCVFVAVYVWR